MMEEISLRIVLTERGSIALKHWKYFEHHKPKYETIVKENFKRVLDSMVSCSDLTTLYNF